jgi:transketolase
VLVSDAECNEGALWEAAMFAAHHKLANLVAIVDANGQQALGYTTDVLDLAPLGNRFRAFGWDVHDVDGHDVEQLARVIEGLDTHAGPPHVLVAATTFGKGVSFMEGLIEWHYLPLTDAQFRTGMTELEGVEA